MGFDSELDDSASECDVEGQRMDAVQAANLKTTAILDSPDHLPIFEGIFYIFFFVKSKYLSTLAKFWNWNDIIHK